MLNSNQKAQWEQDTISMCRTLPSCNVATTYDSGAFPPVYALLQLVEQHRTSDSNMAYNTSYKLLRGILRLVSCTVCIYTEVKKGSETRLTRRDWGAESENRGTGQWNAMCF